MEGARDAAAAAGQVNAALTSMGDGAGRSFDQLAEQAERLSATSLFDDDEIMTKVTANLLTFGNVAEDAFDRAQQAAVDLSARMGGDLQASTVMIGKALNAPTQGLSALRRVGIQFTAQQESQIRAMDAAGNSAGAQAIMLGELERQFGGAAAAARAADPMAAAMLDLGRSMGVLEQHFVPIVSGLAGLASQFAAFMETLTPAQGQMVLIGGAIAAAIGPVLVAAGAVVSAIGTMLPLFAGLGAVISAPFLLVAAAVAAVGLAFWVFRDDIIPVLQAFWEEIQNTLGPALKDLFAAVGEMVAGIGAAFKQFIQSDAGKAVMAFSAMMARTMGGVVVGVLKALLQTVLLVVKGITTAFNVISALLRGDWSGAWAALKAGVGEMLGSVGAAIASFAGNAVRFISGMVDGVARWLTGKLFDVLKSVISKVKLVSDAFFKLYDAVVGNSYVPDMVEGIAHWMAKLDAGMVVPATNATDATREAFENLRDDVSGIFDRLLTDSERGTRQLAQDMAVLDRALAARQINPTQYAQAAGGVAAEGLETGDRIGPLGAMADGLDIAEALRGGVRASQDALDDAANAFADTFARGMGRVLDGDIRGLFSDLLRDVMGEALRGLGRSLFGAMGGGKSGGGNIFGAILGGLKIPGFKTGGSFKVGGAGGADSQLMQFRATPGEMVDIRRPGQDAGGGQMAVHVVPSPYFDVQVERVATPVAGRAGVQAFGAARQQVPADDARRRRFSLTGA
jgi:hypothetical protein